MKRLPHWEDLLMQHFTAARTARFQWGTFDCALAAADGIKAITGIDPAAQYRGKYSTAEGAAQIFGADLGNFAAGIAKANGFQEAQAATFARRGDVVLVNNALAGAPASMALGTVDHTGRFAVCAGEKGLVRVPMRRWLRAWQVG